MKTITSLFLAAALTSAAATAQTTTAVTDSITQTVVTDSTVTTSSPLLNEGEPAETPTVTVQSGRWMLNFDGSDYVISELIEDDNRQTETIDDYATQAAYEAKTTKTKIIPTVVALVFGIPCIGVIAALIVIFSYAMRRNRARNEIIARAIDTGYQLPDSFYNPQKTFKTTEGGNMRDSRKFSSGVTLAAVGLAILILAITKENSFFLICGLIPLFLGIGKLIGYFLLPANTPQPPRYGNYQQQYTPYQPTQPTPPQQPGQPWCAPGQPGPVYPQEPSMPSEIPGDDCGRPTPPPFRQQ